jgi:Pyruvate/2-oxoacid:ferredoxin oxidoreductase delta subunit
VKMETHAAAVGAGNYDLVLLDRTAHPAGSAGAQAVENMAGTAHRRMDIKPKEGGAGFKAVQVAEAVALGRRASSEAGRLLGAAIEESRPSAVLQKGELKSHRLPDQKTRDLLSRAKGSVDEEAVTEAARCLSCGTCNLCQSCVLACPDACCRLDEQEGRITIDLYHCKGCGMCSYECPRGVLIMENLP